MVTNAEHAIDLLYDLGYRPAYDVDNLGYGESAFTLILPDKFDLPSILASNINRPKNSKLDSRNIDIIYGSLKSGSKPAIIWKNRIHSAVPANHKKEFLNHFIMKRDGKGTAYWDVDEESKHWDRNVQQKQYGYGQGIDSWDVEARLRVDLGAGRNYNIYIQEGWIAFSEGGYNTMALLVFGNDVNRCLFKKHKIGCNCSGPLEDKPRKSGPYVELWEGDAAYAKWKALRKLKTPNSINTWEI